jgi:hypothetical protein
MGHPLYKLLRALDAVSIFYTISRHREDSVMVMLTLVGERVEVDIFEDGHMEVSRFFGDERVVGDEELVHHLIRQEVESE